MSRLAFRAGVAQRGGQPGPSALLLVLLFISGAAWADTVSLAPTDDAYVESLYPNSNFGNDSSLYVGDENYNDPIAVCRSYLKFDLSSLPAGSVINSAQVYLRSWGVGPNPTIIVGAHYLPNDSWSEATLTWNNAPTNFNASATASTAINNSATWFAWPVTADVQTAWAGDKVYSVVMKDTTEGTDHNWCGFSSTEDSTPSFRPYLYVDYTPGTGGEVDLSAIDDSYVDSSDSGGNHGWRDYMIVGDWDGGSPYRTCRVYVKFDLSAIPSGMYVQSADLHLDCFQIGGTSVTVDAHYLPNDTWLENYITWNNAPTNFNATATDSVVVAVGDNTWDVTADVQTAFGTDGVLSLVLKLPTEGVDANSARFRTDEYATPGSRPRLHVYYDTTPPPRDFVPGQSVTGVWKADSAWGDFDGDGDLDLVISGEADEGLITRFYENQGGVLVYRYDRLGVQCESSGHLAWGDYDGDGHLDLAVAGAAAGGFSTRVYKNDGAGYLTWDSAQVLTGVAYASVAWGDYDQDGDLDLLVMGYDGTTARTILYKNTNGTLTPDATQSLVGLYAGSADWGDWDGDGDLDLITTGSDGTNRHTIFYRSDNGALVNTGNHGLPDVAFSDTAWGDIDGDGDLDLAFTGETGAAGRYACAYLNDGLGGFSLYGANLMTIYRSSCALGDYDNDGDLDVVFCGYDGSGLHTIICENTGTSFGASFSLAGVREGALNWVDIDDDGNLDLFMTGADWGAKYAQVCRNTGGSLNTSPTAPPVLVADQFDGLLLSWSGGTDPETPLAGLYHCIRVGTAPGADDVMSGTYGTPLMGNAGQGTAFWLDVPPQRYYWSVQTIDSGLSPSPWAPEQVAYCKGDVNCDGCVDFQDINPFVMILTNPALWQATYPDCPMSTGDTNGDGSVGFADINPFITILTNGICGC